MFYFYYADIDNISFITLPKQFQEYHQNVIQFGSWSDQARYVWTWSGLNSLQSL